MPTIESTQHKLDRVRPPRVQISYDVEIGDAIESVELPFVMGILADLAGVRGPTDAAAPALKERKFVEIDRDNFSDIMRSIKPTLYLTDVPDKSPGAEEDATLPATHLVFNRMEDFEPASIVRQVDSLRDLFVERQKLRDLQAKLDGNDLLKNALREDPGELLDQILQVTH